MIKMKISKLELKNFKGLKSFELNTNDENITIFGDNATGKSTLKDGFLWLLFGKDSQNRADFDIKTIDPKTEEAIPGLEHSVEGTLNIDGKELILRKSYYEQWTKKRGSAEKTFTGHTTDYFVNSVPVKKNEYDANVGSIAGSEDIFRLLTDPGYFNEQIHWQERRNILLSICGDIKDKDVIESNENLIQLEEILSTRPLDDHRKILTARCKDINKELERIPIRIDEVTQGLPDISNIQIDEISRNVNWWKQRKGEKEKELLRLESGGETAEKTKQLREVEAQLMDIELVHRGKNEGRIEDLKNTLFNTKDKIQELLTKKGGMEYQIELNERLIKDCKVDIEARRKEWYEVDASRLSFIQSDTCPLCNQKLPKEKLQEAREKALSNFNQDKAGKLEKITARGKKGKKERDEFANKNATIEQEIKKIKEEQISTLEKKTKEIQGNIEDLQKQIVDISENEEYGKKIKEKEEIERNITTLKEGNEKISLAIKEKIEALEAEITSFENSLSQVEQCKRGQRRIEGLKVQEKELAREYEKLQQELYLLEQFTRTKVNMLEKKINSRFLMARFKLFNVLVNGGIEECCNTTYQGVPYGTLNNGARKNIGMDIINTLSNHYGFVTPLWFDNREAVTDLIETEGQLISLVVSKPDKKLRIEREEK